MKRVITMLFVLAPLAIFAQQSLSESSRQDSPAWINVGIAGISTGIANFTSLAFSPSGQPYIAYSDEGNSKKIAVKKYDGANWISMGPEGISDGEVFSLSMAFNLSGEPYVAYCDMANSYKPMVIKYNGSTWEHVGSASGVISGDAQHESLAFSPSGTPYIAFTEATNYSKVTVMKFDGTNWTYVGSPTGVTEGRVDFLSLVFSPAGEPFIAYQDWSLAYKSTVKKFNGTNWVNVGEAGFSQGSTDYEGIAFSASGVPYVGYKDWENENKATVMKLDGSNWVNVGSPGFSTGEISHTSMAVSPSGEPYMAYGDWSTIDISGISSQAVVMKFDGTNWVNVGLPGFSAGAIYDPCLVFNPSGQPYLAFRDNGTQFGKATVMKYDINTTGINQPQYTQVSVYPNPVSGIVNISLENSNNLDFSIEMINSEGIIVCELKSCTKKTALDMANYPTGIYLIKIKTKTSVYSMRFIKD